MGRCANPILRGFNPDPSICRVGEDYYIATSTFEWMPAVAIHHSRDLANWTRLGDVFNDNDMVNLSGVPDSSGIWAPSLSFSDGLFWLVYTIVRTRVGPFKDVRNYVVTAESIDGPWSEPVYLNASGFDPSLFHDDDGRKWLVNMCWDPRPDHPSFGGILLQEYDHNKQQLVGPVSTILTKTELIEGPNLYKVNGRYYLMLAEGGTGWNHGISMARSERIDGPYELDPQHSIMTTRDDPDWPLQKAGHGEMVQTPAGDWYMVHLCSRPIGKERRCVLGRETAIQHVRWTDDGWLRLENAGILPALDYSPLDIATEKPAASLDVHDDFEDKKLSPHFCSLRHAFDPSWMSLTDRPGWLRLTGRESLHSLFEQSLVAQRLTSTTCRFSTSMDFKPDHFTQSAGLIVWYDTRTHYYLRVTHDNKQGRILGVVLTDDGEYCELQDSQVDINDWPTCHLRAILNDMRIQFLASPDNKAWQPIGPELDLTKISDDYGQGLHFTGAMVGLCAQDLAGTDKPAYFDHFTIEHDANADTSITRIGGPTNA